MEPVNTISLKTGLQTGVDNLSSGTDELANWLIDGAGINRPRPGLAAFDCAVLAGRVIGMTEWRGSLIVVTDDRKIWRVPVGLPSVAFPLSNVDPTTTLDGSRRPVFASDSTRLVIAGGGVLQKWEGGPLTERLVTAGDYPMFLATHSVSIANYIVANDASIPDQFHWSNIGDGDHGTWQALSFTTADARPDSIVALADNIRELLVFGQETVQVFGISDDYLLPFSPLATVSVGCSAPYSPVRFDDQYAWLDNRRRFVVGNGHATPDIISGDIAKELRDLPRVDDCWGARLDLGYWTLILWVFPSARTAFVYDVAGKYWGHWRGIAPDGNFTSFAVGAHCYWSALGQHMVAHPTAGLGTLAMANLTDWGDEIVAVRRTGWMNFGTDNRKRLFRLRETMRRNGMSAAADHLETTVRGDAGNWGAPLRVDLGTLGDPGAHEMTRDLYPGCIARRFQFEFRYSGQTPDFALADVEAHATEGSS